MQKNLLKKIIENELRLTLNSTDQDLNQHVKCIQYIKALCLNKVNLDIKLLNGDKKCIICLNKNTQNENKIKYLKCKKCQQVYHQDCVLASSEFLFQELKTQIEESEDYNQLGEQICFEIACMKCNSQDSFNEQINSKKIQYTKELNQLCQQKRDQIYEKIVKEKKNQASCKICNILWLRKQAEHQIFECNLDNDDDFQKEIKLNNDKPEFVKKLMRLSNCKHVYCQDCLSDQILYKQILQEDYNLCCQVESCRKNLTFPEISQLLSSKYNWFMKYKHQKFLIEPLDKIRNDIQFVKCRGVYKLARLNCNGIKLKDRQEVINCIKEIQQLEDQIINNNTHTLPDLKTIKVVKQNDQEYLQCCNRVYQIIRSKDLDMKTFFENKLNETNCENEKQQRKEMYDQYLNTCIKPFPDPTIDQQKDCFLLQCEDESCQFQFCINGCLDAHQTINVCPKDQEYLNNNIFNVGINEVFKYIGGSTLHFKQLNESVIAANGVYCFRCFREIKHDPKNGENQINQQCKCSEEYKKIEDNQEEEEEDMPLNIDDNDNEKNQQLGDLNNINNQADQLQIEA